MKYIIFDIDGTLTDTKGVDDTCFIQAFKHTFGIDISNEDWSKLKHVTDTGITEEIILREFKRLPTDIEYDQMLTEHTRRLAAERDRDIDQFKEVAGAKPFFDYIKGQTKWEIGIATGAWEKSARIKLDSIGIDTAGIAFSNSDHFKSREEITRHTLSQMKNGNIGEVEDVIYFGDGIWDFHTCKNLGIQFIGIDILNDGKLKREGAEVVFKDYTESEKIINEINRIS